MIRVFAYGSNMHLPDLARWAEVRAVAPLSIRGVQRATLGGYRLAWNYRSPSRGEGAANVVRAAGASVPGVVLEVDLATLVALDRKEGHPARYSRGEVPRAVSLEEGGDVSAWVYEVTETYVRPPPVWPRADYLRLMVEAARMHGLPEAHVEELLLTPTVHSEVGVTVRRAAPADALGIARVHAESRRHGSRGHADGAPESEGAEQEAQTWVAVRDGTVVGAAKVGPSRGRGAVAWGVREVWWIHVHPAEAGRGVERALLESIL